MVRKNKGTFLKLARLTKTLKANPQKFSDIALYLPNKEENSGVSVRHAGGKYTFWTLADIDALYR